MRRARVAIASLALIAIVVTVAVARPHGPDTIYSITAVHNGVATAPAAWIGRTVLVRGMAIGLYGPNCAPGSWCAFGLVDKGAPLNDETVLQLQPQSAVPLMALLRQTPGVGRFIPGPQSLLWGRLAVYRIVIQGLPASACAARPCYRAVLPDAPAPDPHGVFVSSTLSGLPRTANQ